MANEFNIQNGFISNNNSTIIGNLNVTGGTQSIFSGNSSTELVRITQTGSGDAFVVEDSTNVDSSHFVINASGDTAIGLTQPLGGAKLTVSGNTNVFGNLSGTTLYGDGNNITNIPNRLIAMTELTASTLVTFIAPSSGNVSIEMLFDMLISNSAAVQMIGLNTTTGATSTPSEGWYRINADNDATSGQFYAQFVKTNLTPGNSYTYYFMGVCNFSGNQVRISSIQLGAYSAGSDLPSPLRIMVYDLGGVSIVSNPNS